MKSNLLAVAFSISLATMIHPLLAYAHCDTMDGPVIADAKIALEQGDVTPVLKWIKPEAEAEVTTSFLKASAVRKTDTAVREIADLWFYETLVRLHRAGEGAPYNGLKAAGLEIDPAIIEADKALETGDVTSLSKDIAEQVSHTIRDRFERVHSAKILRDKSVEAGREYVEAYVSYVHFVENAAKLSASHHEEPVESGCKGDCSDAPAEELHHQH